MGLYQGKSPAMPSFTAVFPKTLQQNIFEKDGRRVRETLESARKYHDALEKQGERFSTSLNLEQIAHVDS